MDKKRFLMYVLSFAIVFVIALGIMAFMVLGRIRTIDTEAQKIAAMDITADTVDETIYSAGKYAVVESTMKNYVNAYLRTVRQFTSIDSDDTLLAMLGASNLQADGPEYIASKAYIQTKRDEIAQLSDTLTRMGTSENVLNAFYEKNMNFFFNWIYRKTMLNTLTLDFFYDESGIQAAADDLNAMLDKKEAVLDFLSRNRSGWQFGNNMIEFTDEKLLEEYLRLVDEI